MPDLSWDTPTMAELFATQGHIGRAVAIYRKVVRDQPHNERAASRLAELEAQLGAQGVGMSFREHMQRIVDSTPGAVACMVMGFDGIAIDSYEVGGGEVDIPTLLIEYGFAAQQLRRAGAEGHGGPVHELSVVGTRLQAVLRPLTDEYFLAVVLQPNGFAGKARYLMRQAAPLIALELS